MLMSQTLSNLTRQVPVDSNSDHSFALFTLFNGCDSFGHEQWNWSFIPFFQILQTLVEDGVGFNQSSLLHLFWTWSSKR